MANKEANNRKYEKGCVMVKTPFENWHKIIAQIEDEDLCELPNTGIEREAHTTVIFGIDADTDPDEVVQFCKDNFGEITVTANKVDFFDNEMFDVLKYSVDKTKLERCTKHLRKSLIAN